MQLPRRL